MGNRAVITTSRKGFLIKESDDIGVYLHWNGGRDSVEAFLEYCELKGYRAPSDDCYGWARLCQVIGNFFGGSCSIGIGRCCELDCDNWDNGTYIIDGWKIIGREYFKGSEQREYDMDEMLLDIDMAQPEKEQLGKDFLSAKAIKTSNIKIRDKVYVFDPIYSKYDLCECAGIGEDRFLNGRNVKGIPYVNQYGTFNDGYDNFANNINNYLFKDVYRVV